MEGDFTTLFIAALSSIFFYGIVAVLSLLFLVALHEFGHFYVARKCGVRIEKFSIGFGRELWGFNDKHGTRWCISLYPLGGYVKIFGDFDPDNPVVWEPEQKASRPVTPEERRVAYFSKSVWQRMAIVMAGPMINLIPAVAVLSFIFSFHGQSSTPPLINGIDIGAAAYEAGFQLGDKILEMDGKPVRRFTDVYDRTMTEPSHVFLFKILRGDQTLLIDMKPLEEKYVDVKGIERSNGRTGMGYYGASLFKDILLVDGISTDKDPDKARELLKERLDREVKVVWSYREDEISIYQIKFPSAFNQHLENTSDKHYDKIFAVDKDYRYYVRLGLWESLQKTFTSTAEVPLELYKRIVARLLGKNDDQIFAGVAKISINLAEPAKEGLYEYIISICIFSITLAIINLLPIPVLDGGHMVFLSYEAIRGKPLPQRIQNYAFIFGIVLLLGIMIFANVSDILHFLR